MLRNIPVQTSRTSSHDFKDIISHYKFKGGESLPCIFQGHFIPSSHIPGSPCVSFCNTTHCYIVVAFNSCTSLSSPGSPVAHVSYSNQHDFYNCLLFRFTAPSLQYLGTERYVLKYLCIIFVCFLCIVAYASHQDIHNCFLFDFFPRL